MNLPKKISVLSFLFTCILSCTIAAAAKPVEKNQPISRILFGSCVNQNDPMPILSKVVADRGYCQDTMVKTIHVMDTVTWTGAIDTDFNKSGNWDMGAIPEACHTVIIPSSPPNQPVLTTTGIEVKRIIIESGSGAELEISGSGTITTNED